MDKDANSAPVINREVSKTSLSKQQSVLSTTGAEVNNEKTDQKESAINDFKSSITSISSLVDQKNNNTTQFLVDADFLNTMKFNTKLEYNNIPKHGIFPLIAQRNVEELVHVSSLVVKY